MRLTIVMPTGRLLGGAERALLAACESAGLRAALGCVVLLEDGDLADHLRAAGVRVELVPLTRVSDARSLARATRDLTLLLRRERSDVVLSWMTKAAFVAGPAARLAGLGSGGSRVRHVVYQHGPAAGRGPRSFDGWAARVPTDLVLACSAWVATSSRQTWRGTPVAVVPPALPAASLTRAAPSAAVQAVRAEHPGPWVVLVSRWQEWKGVHLAVEAAASERWPAEATLVLVGGPVPTEPDYAARVEAAIARCPVPDRVRAVGQQPDGAAWMAAADVVLHLSRDEPFGLVLVEAAAAGATLVSTGGGGADELLARLPAGRVRRVVREPGAVAEAVADLLASGASPVDGGDVPDDSFDAAPFGADAFWRALDDAVAPLHERRGQESGAPRAEGPEGRAATLRLLAPCGATSAHGIVDQARLVARETAGRGREVAVVAVQAPGAAHLVPAPDAPGVTESTVPLRRALAAVQPGDDVVVNWSAYGLAHVRPLGVPLVFALMLRGARARMASLTIVVHEGWDQPERRRSLAGLRAWSQRAVLRLALRAADHVIVNCRRWQQGLPGVDADLVPTPSNIPRVPVDVERRDAIAVFGSAEHRTKIISALLDHAPGTEGLAPDTPILDLGAGDLGGEARSSRVCSLGYLEAPEVSRWLQACRWGAVDIPADVMDKSSVVGAMREHGLAIINLHDGTREPPPDRRDRQVPAHTGDLADLAARLTRGRAT